MAAKITLQKMFTLFEKEYGGVRSFTQERPLDQLIMFILALGSDQDKAKEAFDKLQDEFVDWNEVRVTALHDVDRVIDCLGAKGVEGKSALLRDALGTIYARFNRVDLDMLLEKGDKQIIRKRDRLFAYFAEKSPYLPPLMMSYLGGGRSPVQVVSSVARVLTRTGVFKKGTTPAKIRAKIEEEFSEEEQLMFVNGVYVVAENLCHRSQPGCRVCPLKSTCKAAPEELDKIKKAEDAARVKARKEARKLAEKIAKEAKAAAALAEKRAKKDAARFMAEKKKKDAAKQKAVAKKKAEIKKKAEAKKKATAKKKAVPEKKAAAKKKAPAKKDVAAKKKAPAKKKAVVKKKVAPKKKTATKKTTAKPKSKTPAKAKPAAKKKVAKKTTKKTAPKKPAAKQKTSAKKKTNRKKKKK